MRIVNKDLMSEANEITAMTAASVKTLCETRRAQSKT